jgi:hypothetical protein
VPFPLVDHRERTAPDMSGLRADMSGRDRIYSVQGWDMSDQTGYCVVEK